MESRTDAKIAALPTTGDRTTHPFGGCPECGGSDGYRNIWREQWFFCVAHKTKWCAGTNLLSSWLHETEADWRENREFLEGFELVKPV